MNPLTITTTFRVVGILLGSQDPGHTGGCAITETDDYYMLECTYGSVLDCPADEQECNEVMIYGATVETSDILTEARNLLDYYRAVGFDKMPIPMSANAEIINRTFRGGK